MATITLNYDARSNVANKLLEAILASGFFKKKETTMTQAQKKFYNALVESQEMAADIRKNGIQGYKTLDDLLNED